MMFSSCGVTIPLKGMDGREHMDQKVVPGRGLVRLGMERTHHMIDDDVSVFCFA